MVLRTSHLEKPSYIKVEVYRFFSTKVDLAGQKQDKNDGMLDFVEAISQERSPFGFWFVIIGRGD